MNLDMFLFIVHSIFTVLVCDIVIIHMTPLQINNLGGKLPLFATEDSTGMYSSHQSKLVIKFSKKLKRHPCTYVDVYKHVRFNEVSSMYLDREGYCATYNFIYFNYLLVL